MVSEFTVSMANRFDCILNLLRLIQMKLFQSLPQTHFQFIFQLKIHLTVGLLFHFYNWILENVWRGVILDSAAELHLFFAFRYIWSYSSFGTTALTFESVQILYINIYFLLHNFNCMKFFILKLSCLSFKLHCFLVLNGVDRLLDIAVFASN